VGADLGHGPVARAERPVHPGDGGPGSDTVDVITSAALPTVTRRAGTSTATT
jgi:hypothetical protein